MIMSGRERDGTGEMQAEEERLVTYPDGCQSDFMCMLRGLLDENQCTVRNKAAAWTGGGI